MTPSPDTTEALVEEAVRHVSTSPSSAALIDRLATRLTELEAENKRLVTALAPFARLADLLDQAAPDAGYSPDSDAVIATRPAPGSKGAVTVGDLRRARAARAEGKPAETEKEETK